MTTSCSGGAAAEAAKRVQFGRWEQLQISGTSPSVRFAHSTAVVEGTLYVFGGSRYGEAEVTLYHNDMYTLKLDILEWEKVDQKGSVPTPREGAIFVAVKGSLYLYGGTDKEGVTSCAQGVFLFERGTNTWTKHNTTGPAPKALSMSGILCDGKIVTFGGVLSCKGCNSVHMLDIGIIYSQNLWNGMKYIHMEHDLSRVSQQDMFVCAGTGSDELWFNDLHRLSIDSLEWREVKQKGNPPSPRDYSTLVAINNWYLVLYGGSCAMGGSEESFSDLHYIDITSGSPEWYSVEVEGDHRPPSRYSHSMIVWKNKLYVFGGQDTDHVYNDVWAIEFTLPLTTFTPSSVPRHSYATSVPIPSPREAVQPSPPQAVKRRDFEELRSTYLQRINDMFDCLGEHFHKLDVATEKLAVERGAFELERASHAELYERQQSELTTMMETHRSENEAWIEKMRIENDSERKELAEQKVALEQAQAELATDRQAFTEKSKKLDAIMKQVQGLQEP